MGRSDVSRRPAMLVCATAALAGSAAAVAPLRASPPMRDEPRSIDAAFSQRSYRPSERARLVVRNPPAELRVTIFHAGPVSGRLGRDDVMTGIPVTPARSVAAAAGHA